MEYDSSRSGTEQPWRPLMQGFLALLETETSHDRANAICHLFLGDPVVPAISGTTRQARAGDTRGAARLG